MSMASEPMTSRDGSSGRWSSFASQWSRYDRMLGDFGRRAIAAASVTSGERVVDIGCGAGGSTLDAAVAVGPSGQVTGIDVNPQSIEVARERAASAELGQVAFMTADAQIVTVEEPFDALISRFGVHQFDDPKVAYRNLGRLIRPGGRLAVTCWREAERNAWAWVGMKALSRVAPRLPRREGGHGPFVLADPLRVVCLLEAAGLGSIRVESIDELAWVGNDVGETIAFFEQTDAAQVIRSLGTDQRADLLGLLRDELAPFASERGVYVPASAWLFSARVRQNPRTPWTE